jgi:hypothetical protein
VGAGAQFHFNATVGYWASSRPTHDLAGLQRGLDIAGMAMQGPLEPLGPVVDAASGMVSAVRGDWWGAGTSLLAAVPVVGGLANAAKVARGPGGARPTAYSVVFETTIAQTGAGTREAHKALANRDLVAAASDKEFAQMLSSMNVNPVGGAGTPTGFQWHHATDRPGVMQLVPESQHTPGSIFQDLLHPGGRGGFAQWGRGW